MSKDTPERFEKQVWIEPGAPQLAELFPNGNMVLHFEGSDKTWTSKSGQYCDMQGILHGMVALRGDEIENEPEETK